MDNSLYVPLSAMMFLEYAVWGAWAPVLAARLLGPLKMSGKQTGWIYATLPLASMISPPIAGQLADKYVDMGWILAGAHLLGAILLFVAARQTKFARLFVVMLLYSMCFGATIPLVNALMFRHLTDAAAQSPGIFIWAPIAWALVGYALTGWRQLAQAEGDGSDCLIFAGLLSVAMAIVCLFQPATPPQPEVGTPLLEAISMLRQPSFLVFIVASMVAAGMMQFYFLGTAPLMQENGISSKNVPACMAVAQAVQAAATFGLLSWFYKDLLGPKWTLTAGAASWLVMYGVYVATKNRWLVVAVQSLHGLAYVLFIIAGQTFVNQLAGPKIAGSAQALIILATMGIGLFLGTQAAGAVMDRFCVGGKFQWGRIYTIPLVCMLLVVVALALGVHAP